MRAFAVSVCAFFLFGGTASAAFVGGSQITPSTDLSAVSPWTIDQISDGITADDPPYNGFVSTSPSGTIRLLFDKPYDINGFSIWNDVHVQAEGINHFRLDFYDNSLNLISSSTTLQAPQDQFDPANYSLTTVTGVKRVNLVVLDSYVGSHTRIEIREVAFSAVPEPTGLCVVGGVATAATMRRKRRIV